MISSFSTSLNLNRPASFFPKFSGEEHPHDNEVTEKDHLDKHIHASTVQSEHVHGPECHHNHDEEDHHDHSVKTKLGDRFKNPIIRAVVNFVGWFYELFSSFFKDALGVKSDETHDHHDHDHHQH